MTAPLTGGRGGPVLGILRLVPRGRAALGVVLGALVILCGAALLAVSGALITGAAQRPETLFVLLPLITAVRLFGVARPVLRYVERLVTHDLTLRLVGRLRAGLLAALVPLAPAALTGARGGDLLARVRADVDELQGVVVRLVAPAVVAGLAGSVAVVLVGLVSPPLAGVLAVLLVLLGVAVPVVARRAGRSAAIAAADADAAFGADVLDLVRGLADHATGDGGATVLRLLDDHLDDQARAERSLARLTAVTTALREGVPVLGLLAALWLVGRDVAAGTTAPLLLAAAALGVLGAFEAVGGLGAAYAAADGVRAAAGRVAELEARRPAVTDPSSPRALPDDAALRFRAVSLTYPGASAASLSGLDLDVGVGEKVALTGPSGAGKSSVLALALRARDPDTGSVTLGGVDLRDLSLADVRAASAWVPQAPALLGSSLAANLRLGRPGATDAELTEVLHTVELDPLLDAPGLDGWVGEGGSRLSAGERARVGLARALLAPAPLLLLDEPTAHLDGPLAARLLDHLARLDRAVLLVTHRPDALDPRWRTVTLT